VVWVLWWMVYCIVYYPAAGGWSQDDARRARTV